MLTFSSRNEELRSWNLVPKGQTLNVYLLICFWERGWQGFPLIQIMDSNLTNDLWFKRMQFVFTSAAKKKKWIKLMWSYNVYNPYLQLNVNFTWRCAGFALVLQGDQCKVDTFALQELTVSSPLHSPSMLKTNDDVCISNGGKSVGDRNCCPAHAHLHIQKLTRCHTTKNECVA